MTEDFVLDELEQIQSQNSAITQHDIDSLGLNALVNDNIMNYVFKHRQYLLPIFDPSSFPHLLMAYNDANLRYFQRLHRKYVNSNLIIVPICYRLHWSIVIMIRDTHQCNLYHLDSLPSDNLHRRIEVVQVMLFTAQKIWNILDCSFNEMILPMQINGYDCGIYAMKYVDTICRLYSNDQLVHQTQNILSSVLSEFTPNDATDYRTNLRLEIQATFNEFTFN